MSTINDSPDALSLSGNRKSMDQTKFIRLIKMKTINKIQAWFNVIIRLLIVDLLFRAFAPILFPIAWILRWMGKFNPLWIFLDDDCPLGNKEECWNLVGFEPDTWWHKFRCAYYWSAIRNVAWNSYKIPFLKGINSRYPFTDYNYDNCTIIVYNQENLKKHIIQPVNIKTRNSRMNRAKFYSYNNEGVKSDSSNEGTYIDFELSFFGKSLYYFKNNGKWWFLYTHCWIKSWNINRGFKVREFNIGAVDTRCLIRNKKQNRLIQM